MDASKHNLKQYNEKRKKQGNVIKTCTCGNTFTRKKYRAGKFCSLKCQAQHKTKTANLKNIELFKSGQLVLRDVIKKTMYAMGTKHECFICGITEWENKPITMVLDHIDGRANNNFPKNLRLICHNCDSQTSHYKGRNKGQGRKSLGLIR